MKKKLVLLTAVCMLTFGLMACGNQGDTTTDPTTESSATESTTEATTESSVEEATPESAEAVIPEGAENFNNVYYVLGDYWTFNSDQSGTRLYTNADATETFAFYVQNESYSAEDMVAAYETSIASTYGENSTTDTYEANGLTWNVYSFGNDNLVNAAVNVNVYLYSDGATTIYIENAFADGTETSGEILNVINSIVME